MDNKLLDLIFRWDTNISFYRNDAFVSPEDSHHPSTLLAASSVAGNGPTNQVIVSDQCLFAKTIYLQSAFFQNFRLGIIQVLSHLGFS